MSGFIPTTAPGNIRPVGDNFGTITQTNDFYQRSSDYLPLFEDSGTFADTPSGEICAMLIKVYNDSRQHEGIPDSPNFEDHSTFAGTQGSVLGSENQFTANITTSDSSGKYKIFYDDSPACVPQVKSEGSHTFFYDFENMSPGSERIDKYGNTYRQARLRFEPVNKTTLINDGTAFFVMLDLARRQRTFPANDDEFQGRTFDSGGNSTTYNSGYAYQEGTKAVDFHLRLVDKTDGSSNNCELAIGHTMPLRALERIRIHNSALRPIKIGDSGGYMYNGKTHLQDIGECPFFVRDSDTTNAREDRYRSFRLCSELTVIPDSFADPERGWMPAVDVSSAYEWYEHFRYCHSLRYIPEGYFTSGMSSPNQVIPKPGDFRYMFQGCHSLKHIPRIPMKNFIPDTRGTATTDGNRMTGMFRYCYSLERIPDGVNLKGIWQGDTNAHSSANSSGLSNMFQNMYSLKDFNEINLDDMSFCASNGEVLQTSGGNQSPKYPTRMQTNQAFTGMGHMGGIKEFPYIGSFESIGVHIQDGGRDTPASNNDVYYMFQHCGFDRFASPYNKHGLNFSNFSDHVGVFYECQHLKYAKIKWISESPSNLINTIGPMKDLSKATSTTAIMGGGFAGVNSSSTSGFYRMFYNNYSIEKIDMVGMQFHGMSDEANAGGSGEYYQMFHGDYALQKITGFNAAIGVNDSNDYSSMFNACRGLQSITFGDNPMKNGYFDGSNDYIDTGMRSDHFRPASADTAYTISAVAAIDTLSTTEGLGRLIVLASGGSTRGGIEINSEDDGSTGRAHFRIGGTHYASDGTGTGATAVAITTAEKVHVCATVDFTGTDTATINLYVDGVLTHTVTGQSMGGAAGSTSIKVGSNGDGTTHFFDGRMYDVRAYNKVLSADEVKKLSDHLLYLKYDYGAEEGTDKNLVFHYDFSELRGTVIHNKSNNFTRPTKTVAAPNVSLDSVAGNGTLNGESHPAPEFWRDNPHLGFRRDISLQYCRLTPKAMREIFIHSSPNTTGQDITLTDNEYTDMLTQEDKAIATDKGWTLVLGS